jgi:DNA topoisomerase-1
MHTQADVQELHPDAIVSVKEAGLRHTSDTKPGIQRKKSGDGFTYIGPDGETIKDEETLKRIRSLAIPPAYTDVWICPHPKGYLQATGRDTKGRKQYRYHPKWREVRDGTKYTRMIAFGKALPRVRERVFHDLSLPGLKRERVLATIVRLLETTMIRVGNEEYAKTNKSFGLTTLRNRHVDIGTSDLRFHFRGKSGKDHSIELRDRRLARIVARLRELPGQELFQYVDSDGTRHSIDSGDVNAYLREISGSDFTAKDFRTWAGTVLAALALCDCEECDTETERKKNVVRAIEAVSQRLGNTPSICRKCYVHPAVIESFMEGTLGKALKDVKAAVAADPHALDASEAAVMRLLRKR